MTPERVFSIANSVALIGWIILIATPRLRWPSRVISSRLIPLLLAGTYLVILALHWGEGSGGFGSLTAVATLFANRWALLGGWIHYLAFDLFIGSWEVQDAAERNISHWFVIPCLLMTFLLGPVGLLMYFGLRTMLASKKSSA